MSTVSYPLLSLSSSAPSGVIDGRGRGDGQGKDGSRRTSWGLGGRGRWIGIKRNNSLRMPLLVDLEQVRRALRGVKKGSLRSCDGSTTVSISLHTLGAVRLFNSTVYE